MRIFPAGASGAIGTRLVPQLAERGHEVIDLEDVAVAPHDLETFEWRGVDLPWGRKP
jgi:nucleoside-diphosphate-sugar epimerase